MTIARKGSRRILVGAAAYRWTIRPRPSYRQALAESNLSFAVELEDDGRTTLVVTMGAPRPDNWMMIADVSVISSATVKRAIELALQQGWRPGEAGGAYRLSMSSEK